MKKPAHTAVIGAGWAGCAAAVKLAAHGHRVSLLEAARTLGGRARRVELDGRALDNGQHILLGAYRATLALMQQVGVDPRQAMLRLPLQMRYPAGAPDAGMDFVAPRLPAPWHVALALLRARGLARSDKLALMRFSSSARWMGWRLHDDCSVATLLQTHDQPARLVQLLWRPLCIAALNTPPERASAQVFLNVLRDSLGARRSASDMLVPRQDLTALLPQAAAGFIERHGGEVRSGVTVTALQPAADDAWQLHTRQGPLPGRFDNVVVATGAEVADHLLADVHDTSGQRFDTGALRALQFEPISTCYLQYDAALRLPHPMLALVDDASRQAWGQFVFDRGQLSGQAADQGLLAVVVSAAAQATLHGHAELEAGIQRQLATDFARPELASPLWSRVITDKRATFSCTPGLQRPDGATLPASLALAGDYVAGDYPATLEGAVRSGIAAAKRLRR